MLAMALPWPPTPATSMAKGSFVRRTLRPLFKSPTFKSRQLATSSRVSPQSELVLSSTPSIRTRKSMESKEKLRRALEYLDSRTDLTRELVQDMVRRSSLGSGGEEGTSPPPEVVEGVEQSMEAMVISAGGRGVEEPALKRMKGETVEVKEDELMAAVGGLRLERREESMAGKFKVQGPAARLPRGRGRFCSKFQVTKESEAMTRSLAEARITPRARRVGRRKTPA